MAIEPVLERPRVARMESVEQSTSVCAGRSLRLMLLECPLELPDITVQPFGIQPQLVTRAEDTVLTQRTAQQV